MDLKRIEDYTRDELEQAARERGLEDVEFLTRSELVQAILGADATRGTRPIEPSGPVGAARAILKRVADLALGVVARRSSAPPPPGSPPPPPGSASPPPATDVPAAPPSPLHELHGRRESERPAMEPIRTRTMARLLASQGHEERALTIYDELVAKQPNDVVLGRERESVRRMLKARLAEGDGHARAGESPAPRATEPAARKPRPARALDTLVAGADQSGGEPAGLPAGHGRDIVHALVIDPSALLVTWEVTPPGLLRAGSVLDETGELVVRVVVIARDKEALVRSRILEHGPVPRAGDWVCRDLPVEATCFAAVGLRGRGRFVAIAHASGERLPRPGPADELSSRVVRVDPSNGDSSEPDPPRPSPIPMRTEDVEHLRSHAADLVRASHPDYAPRGGALLGAAPPRSGEPASAPTSPEGPPPAMAPGPGAGPTAPGAPTSPISPVAPDLDRLAPWLPQRPMPSSR